MISNDLSNMTYEDIKKFGVAETEGNVEITGCSGYDDGMCEDETGKYCDGCASFRG